MTPDDFRAARETLRWTRRDLAARLGRPEGTLRQWEGGKVQIPDDVAAWLERMARFAERNPPPRRAA
jgi:DNA-binding transcriptional regulator YiaG